MNIFQQVSLADYSTMRLGGTAAYMAEVHSRRELSEAVSWANDAQVPIITVGGGSNIVWRDEGFQGLLIVNKILRYETFEEDAENVYVTVGAGEVWDSVVERSVAAGLTGIEALSLIPGNTGATPVQNVGAYGQEIADSLTTLEAYDREINQFVTLRGSDCDFAYRTSRFKTVDHGRFIITAVTLHLLRGNPKPPFYPAVQSYFDEHDIHDFTPAHVREAVIAIRSAKLPDPALVANNGSFFANPIIDEVTATQLTADFPDMIYWPLPDSQIKLSAAWLIEQVGFKGISDSETGMATWEKQPLVLVNKSAVSTSQLLTFKQKIVDAVQAKFGVTLVQEPELLP